MDEVGKETWGKLAVADGQRQAALSYAAAKSVVTSYGGDASIGELLTAEELELELISM